MEEPSKSFAKSPNVYFKLLAQRMPKAEICEKIGISSSYYSKMLQEDEISRSYEVAARGLYMQGNEHIVILKVAEDSPIFPVLDAMNISYTKL